MLRARGKKVLCSLEDNGSRSLYVCANADRTVVNPAGGIRYAGLRSQYIYLGGLLTKLGVKAEFVRIGAHKSAPEQFENEHASPVAAADHEDFLRNVEAVFVRNLGNGRHMTDERVREVTLHGPYVAQEAKDYHLVDGMAFDDQLQHVAREMVGKPVSLDRYEEPSDAPKAFGSQQSRHPLHRRPHGGRSLRDHPPHRHEALRFLHDRRYGARAPRRLEHQGGGPAHREPRRIVDGGGRDVA